MHRHMFCFFQESKLENIGRDLIRRFWENDNFEFKFKAVKGRSRGVIPMWDKVWFLDYQIILR